MAKRLGRIFMSGLDFGKVKRKAKAMNTEGRELYGKKAPSNSDMLVQGEEKMVGFDEEELMIKEQLTGGRSQLEIISILGMPGQGKTTLALKVYNDPLIAYHFHIRSWVNISQDFNRQELLINLLRSIGKHTDACIREMLMIGGGALEEELRKCLKGKRYLIVLDDIWDARAWEELKCSFPNDNNGSRVIFTSRLASVATQARPNCRPLYLRPLTGDESWDLFQYKVFRSRQSCPPELARIGKKIVKKCQGLPLTIVLAAGTLANRDKREEHWQQVAENLTSRILTGDSKLCVRTISLSYNHLPYHLKQCFLYFGGFPEDHNIPAQKLISLWIAEGFVQENGNSTNLEDVAEEYLSDLVSRSLVTVSGRSSNGRIKACSIHDLLHDFCLREAKRTHFLEPILCRQPVFSLFKSLRFSRARRLCIHSEIQHLSSLIPSSLDTHSLLYINSYSEIQFFQPIQFISRLLGSLKVLDISSIRLYMFPVALLRLVHLRYLALGTIVREIPPHPFGYCVPASISNLCYLETLILRTTVSPFVLPQSIKMMVKLRHLFLGGEGIYRIKSADPSECPDSSQLSSLDSLLTLSCVDPWSWHDSLIKTPNLRKLGFRGHLVSSSGCLIIPEIYFLKHLQELRLINTRRTVSPSSTNLQNIHFPPNVTSVTLERTYLKWDDMATLAKLLPNLEVLKLSCDAFRGTEWETSEVFPRLKFLKFTEMKLKWWDACSEHFPSLQRLVFSECSELVRIPSEIGDIFTLRMIEVHSCSSNVLASAMQIKETQESMGNDLLQVSCKRSVPSYR